MNVFSLNEKIRKKYAKRINIAWGVNDMLNQRKVSYFTCTTLSAFSHMKKNSINAIYKMWREKNQCDRSRMTHMNYESSTIHCLCFQMFKSNFIRQKMCKTF